MKNCILLFLVFSTIISCDKAEKLNEIESRIANIEEQNKMLIDSLKLLNSEFIEPFKVYEKIVLSELKNAPNQIISDYQYLLKNFPNSFWKHEAKKRIENIENRKRYWSEKDGWKLPNKPKFIELNRVTTISCPGC